MNGLNFLISIEADSAAMPMSGEAGEMVKVGVCAEARWLGDEIKIFSASLLHAGLDSIYNS